MSRFCLNQRILPFSCFQTLPVILCPVSVTFLPYISKRSFCPPCGPHASSFLKSQSRYFQGILSFLLFLDTFRIQKCLETGIRQNPLKKSLFQGSLSFLLFQDTFGKCCKVQGVLSFPLFPDTSTEMSAAGARRGVCNCIRTTIPSRPAGRRLARA